MTGFPGRPYREELGPEPVNSRPVRSPERELDAETVGKLMFHQIIGSGLMVDLAELEITVAASPTLHRRREAWNVHAATADAYAPPNITRSGAGIFTIAYGSTVPDQHNVLTPLVFNGGTGIVLDGDPAAYVYNVHVQRSSPANSQVAVRVRRQPIGGGAWTHVDQRVLVVLR